MVTFRAALEPDLDRLVDIHAMAFPDPRDEAARLRNFAENPLGSLDDLHVAELDGVVVAHAFLFSMAAWFGGRRVPVGGVASVGVAPEVRGRGIARALIEHLHDLAHARGDALTLLHAFRQGYYARLGYAPAAPMKRLAFAPASLPRASGDDGLRVRAATGADRAAIEAVHLRAARAATGVLERPPAAWEARFQDPRRQWFVAARGEELVGFLAFTVRQAEAHARVSLHVRDLHAVDDRARWALLGVLSALRDQVTCVELEVTEDDPLDRALTDADAYRHGDELVEHALGTLAGGPMVRLCDAERALEARGYATDGALAVHLTGQARSLGLRVDGGRARVGQPGSAPGVYLDARALTAVAFGGLSVRGATRLGWVRGEADALAAAEALLALPAFTSSDPF